MSCEISVGRVVVFIDVAGARLRVGDTVLAAAFGDGVPPGSFYGRVVGLGRSLLYVRWDDSRYSESTKPYHQVSTEKTEQGRRAPLLLLVD